VNRFILIVFIILFQTSQAQQWSLRGSFNMLRSYNYLKITELHNSGDNISISPTYNKYYHLFNRLRTFPPISSFFERSVQRNFNKHLITVGYRTSELLVYSTIGYKTNYYTTFTGHAEGIRIHAVKINYGYSFLKKDLINSSTLTLLAGVLLNFHGAEETFSNSGWGSSSGHTDSSGNYITDDYLSVKQTSFKRPKYPVPYLNFGVEGGLRISSRFKIGLELSGYLGYKTLYVQENSGVTKDAQFTYEIMLKPYFFSGGIFLQYRIK
jgi:hypothetical protein